MPPHHPVTVPLPREGPHHQHPWLRELCGLPKDTDSLLPWKCRSYFTQNDATVSFLQWSRGADCRGESWSARVAEGPAPLSLLQGAPLQPTWFWQGPGRPWPSHGQRWKHPIDGPHQSQTERHERVTQTMQFDLRIQGCGESSFESYAMKTRVWGRPGAFLKPAGLPPRWETLSKPRSPTDMFSWL